MARDRGTVEQVIDGLADEVVITRDRHGIPRVSARTVPDLFVGQGFATATDRLGQMEWDRRRGLGRTAELHGTAANVVTDAHHRRLRLADHARVGYESFDDETRQVFDAYVDGVNAVIEAGNVPIELVTLDAEPERWEPWTPVLIFLVRHVSFGTWQSKLWELRVLAGLGAGAVGQFDAEGRTGETPVIVPPGVRAAVAQVASSVPSAMAGDPAAAASLLDQVAPLGLSLSGSNAWAVGGARTAGGSPLIAGDPHRVIELPGVYYQLRLDGPEIDVSGISFVGVPGIQHFGQTPSAAWAVTNAMADYQDLFVERLPDAITDQRVETMDVRDGESIEVACLTTTHGPVVVGDPGDGIGIALASTGLRDPGGSLRTILPFLRARSVSDLAAAVADWVEPANNFVLADAAGHIGYRTAGLIPRRSPLNQYVPVPGWDPGHDWVGYIPSGELPAVDDPDIGAVVTANQRVTDAPIAAELSPGYPSASRANRIWVRLGDRTGLTVEDQRRIHTDDVWENGVTLAARVSALGGAGASRLAGWDGRMAVDSTAATFAVAVFDELVRSVTAALPASLRDNPFARWEPPATALPAELYVARGLAGALKDDTDEVAPGLEWAGHLPDAVAAALAGPETPWGEVHRLTPRFALRGADPGLDAAMTVTSPPLGGGQDCVWATNQVPGLTTAVLTGSTARYVWDLADRSKSRWIVPLGASGDPESAHFTDQLAAWSAGELIPVLDDEVTASATLRPGR